MAAVTIDNTNRRLEIEEDALTAGEDSGWLELPQDLDREALLAWFPGAGGTMTVEYTIDTLATVRADSAEAVALVTASSDDGNDALPSIVTAVRFSAITEDGKYRVVV